MDPRPGEDATNMVARQGLAAGLVTGVLGRPLDATEDALLGWAVATLARTGKPFTLTDLAADRRRPRRRTRRTVPTHPARARPGRDPGRVRARQALHPHPAGMFDGPTTVDIDWDHGAGFVIDLSAVYNDREALPLVMLAATSWLSAVLQRATRPTGRSKSSTKPGPRCATAPATSKRSLKLARTYGVSTWLICHRPADLTAQADDGTADAKIAAGLLSDIQTRDRVPPTRRPSPSPRTPRPHPAGNPWIGQFVKGRALWHLGQRAAVVQGVLTEREAASTGTDGAM